MDSVFRNNIRFLDYNILSENSKKNKKSKKHHIYKYIMKFFAQESDKIIAFHFIVFYIISTAL